MTPGAQQFIADQVGVLLQLASGAINEAAARAKIRAIHARWQGDFAALDADLAQIFREERAAAQPAPAAAAHPPPSPSQPAGGG